MMMVEAVWVELSFHYLCIINLSMSTPALYMRSMHEQKGTDYSITLTSGQLEVY